jgi:hypothetical protein
MFGLVYAIALTLLLPPSWAAAQLTVTGAWTINRALTQPPARDGIAGERRAGLPEFGGGYDSREIEDRKVEVIRRRLIETPDRLIITTAANHVTITDGLGRSYHLKSDGKKQERVTGDGEFTTRTRFNGGALIVEDDFGGPTLTTTYTPILAAGEITRLIVTLKPDRLPGAARQRLERRVERDGGGEAREITRVYDAEPK